MALPAKPFSSLVKGCARCGGDHEDVVFTPLTRPILAGSYAKSTFKLEINATHWAPCPTNGEPIMMMTLADEPDES